LLRNAPEGVVDLAEQIPLLFRGAQGRTQSKSKFFAVGDSYCFRNSDSRQRLLHADGQAVFSRETAELNDGSRRAFWSFTTHFDVPSTLRFRRAGLPAEWKASMSASSQCRRR
jgi:hypothetical protein